MTALRRSFLVAWLALIALSAGLATAALHRHIGPGVPDALASLASHGAEPATPNGVPAPPGDDDAQHHDCALCSAAATITGATLLVSAAFAVSLVESPIRHRTHPDVIRRADAMGAFEARAPPAMSV